jgi:hypothetical protein
MGAWSARQQAAVGAFAVVALWVIGFFIAGKPPKFADSPDKVAHFYATNHKQVLIAVILVAIGIALYIAVLAQLSLYLRGSGQRTLAAVVMLATASSAAVFAIGDALYGAIGQVVASPGADPALAAALYKLDQISGVPMYWLVLITVFSVTLAERRGLFPRWALPVNLLFMLLLVLGGISVRASGVFAAGTGLFATLAFGSALLFLVEIGVVLWGAKERPAES